MNQDGEKIDDNCNDPTIGSANTQVKILKYYSGATLSGTVELDGIGPVPNARLLIERDAFSGEEVADDITGMVTDRDPRTYWIPIGTTDADENGMFEFTVPRKNQGYRILRRAQPRTGQINDDDRYLQYD